MIKELKYFFFISVILLFLFLTLKYYFSEIHKKHSYRSLKKVDENIINFSQDLILLKNNTLNVVEFVQKSTNKDKKRYNFWNLIKNNEK